MKRTKTRSENASGRENAGTVNHAHEGSNPHCLFFLFDRMVNTILDGVYVILYWDQIICHYLLFYFKCNFVDMCTREMDVFQLSLGWEKFFVHFLLFLFCLSSIDLLV